MFVFTVYLFPSSKVTQLFRCASYNEKNRQAEYINNEMMSMKYKYNLMAENEQNINVNQTILGIIFKFDDGGQVIRRSIKSILQGTKLCSIWLPLSLLSVPWFYDQKVSIFV